MAVTATAAVPRLHRRSWQCRTRGMAAARPRHTPPLKKLTSRAPHLKKNALLGCFRMFPTFSIVFECFHTFSDVFERVTDLDTVLPSLLN